MKQSNYILFKYQWVIKSCGFRLLKGQIKNQRIKLILSFTCTKSCITCTFNDGIVLRKEWEIEFHHYWVSKLVPVHQGGQFANVKSANLLIACSSRWKFLTKTYPQSFHSSHTCQFEKIEMKKHINNYKDFNFSNLNAYTYWTAVSSMHDHIFLNPKYKYTFICIMTV